MFNTSTDNSIVTLYLCNRYFLQYQDTLSICHTGYRTNPRKDNHIIKVET